MSCVSRVSHTVWTTFEAKAPKCCSLGLLALRDKVVALMQRIWHLFVKPDPVVSKLKELFPGLTDAKYQTVLNQIKKVVPKDAAFELTKVNEFELKISWETQSSRVRESRTFIEESGLFREVSSSMIYKETLLVKRVVRSEVKYAIEAFARAYPEGQFEIITRPQSDFYIVRGYKNGSEGDALEFYVPSNRVDVDCTFLPVGGAYALREGIKIDLNGVFPQAAPDEISYIIRQLDRVIRADYLKKDDPTLMTSFSWKYNQETKRFEFRAERTTEPKWVHVIEVECSERPGLRELDFSFTFAPFKEGSHWEILTNIFRIHCCDSSTIMEELQRFPRVPAQFRISVGGSTWKVEALDAKGKATTISEVK